jgi:hypothetical protein
VIPDTDMRQPGSIVKPARPRRRWLALAVWVVAAVALFAVYLRLARTTAVNSDGSGIALQAWDLVHGNLLLGGWKTADVTFYTFEMPEFALIELARGLAPGVVQVGAAITYTLVTLLSVALAKGTATGREAVLRAALAAGILLAPELVWGTHELLSSPDHIGSTMPVLVAWLILERAPRRWWVPVVTTVLLAWTTIGDQVVLAIAIAPLVGVSVLRLFRSADRWYEISLAAGGVVAAVIGMAAPRLIKAVGGFFQPSVISAISPAHTIVRHNLPLTAKGLLILFGAYRPGLPAGPQTWFALLHLVGLALVAGGVLITAWRFFRGEDRVPQLLLTGIVVVVAAYLVGVVHAAVLENAREISAVVPFGAVLAARQLTPYLKDRPSGRRIAVPVLGVVLAGYVAGLGVELTVPAVPPENVQLTGWLVKHPLGGTGLSGYWESNVVTLTSGERAGVRSLNVSDGRVIPHDTETKREWWDPARSYADFVVLGPPVDAYGYPGFTKRAEVIATFGKPAREYHVGPYTILQWHKNLLTDLRRHA